MTKRFSSVKTAPTFLFSIVLLGMPLLAQYPDPDISTGNAFAPPRSSHDCNIADNLLTNCSFETGDFTGWVPADLSAPFVALQVNVGGLTPGFGFFASTPTDGTMAALNGYDGNGPGTIELGQDVVIPPGAVTLEFDYRGAWDMTFGATQDRTFSVNVEPSGGGAAMQTDLILTSGAGTTITDTGPLSATLDLSAFSGQSVRVNFVWDIPETNTGPGFFQIDNVLLTSELLCTPVTINVVIGGDVDVTGLAGCIFDLYNTHGSNDPADWTLLAANVEIPPSGTVTVPGVVGQPDTFYLATVAGDPLQPLNDPVVTVPTLQTWGVIALISLLMVGGLMVIRRRRMA